MSIELSAISEICKDSDRTRLMAWYNLAGSFSTAAGSLFCGILISTFNEVFNISLLSSYKMVMVVYVLIKITLCFFFSQLSPAIEPKKVATNTKLVLGLHKSQAIVAKLSILFMLDSFAGSLILQSLITNWFHLVWKTSATKLGTIIFVCNILAGVSALFAARLADFIGLIMTMVVTHLPSNVMIMLVPLLPNETLAMIMLCARFSISQMDVPTRNAYVQGVVAADERSAANGITNIVRSIGASIGPYLAGLLYNNKTTISYPFYIAGLLKIIYDLLLLHSFKSIRPPEELVSQHVDCNDNNDNDKKDNYNNENNDNEIIINDDNDNVDNDNNDNNDKL
jgi:MFS family permease